MLEEPWMNNNDSSVVFVAFLATLFHPHESKLIYTKGNSQNLYRRYGK